MIVLSHNYCMCLPHLKNLSISQLVSMAKEICYCSIVSIPFYFWLFLTIDNFNKILKKNLLHNKIWWVWCNWNLTPLHKAQFTHSCKMNSFRFCLHASSRHRINIYLFSCMLHLCSTQEFKHSVHRLANVFIFKIGMLERRGRREVKRFMKLPLKVNMGFKLHLWRCEDLCLISFRCWLAWVWAGEGSGVDCTHTHTHILCSQPIFAVSHYQRFSWPCVWKNRATFVPTSQMASCGCLQQLYDNTQPIRAEQRQMERLI